jgi:hypothetical protein
MHLSHFGREFKKKNLSPFKSDLCIRNRSRTFPMDTTPTQQTNLEFWLVDFHSQSLLCVHVRPRCTACTGQLKCDGTRAETRFRLSAKRTSPFKSAEASVQSTTGSRGVRISGSNAVYTMFRGSVKGTGYPLHSPVSPSHPLPCITVCHHISTGVYRCDHHHGQFLCTAPGGGSSLISRKLATWRWKACQPHAPAAFTHQVLLSVRGWFDPRAIVRPEGLCQW